MTVRIGTRGSRLALAQSRAIAAALERAGERTELVIVQTQGDHVLDAPLAAIGGKGVFTKEIEQALLDGRIDLAVHSLKDLPTQDAEGLAVAAIPPRESPWDVLVARAPVDLAELADGACIGTSSLRRAAQLGAKFPTLAVRNLRGNVPTRIRKMTEGQYDAIVLAEAGIRRLGLEPPWMQRIDPEVMLPAPGQGALGLQIRADDRALAQKLAALNDAPTAACCTAERTLLDRLGGGCQVPLGAWAYIEGERLHLWARVLSPDGATAIECRTAGPVADAVAIGEDAARTLRSQGADALIAQVQAQPPVATEDPAHAPTTQGREVRVVVTRDEDADGPLSRALRERNLVPVCLPLIRVRPIDFEPCSGAFDWVVVTSPNASAAVLRGAGGLDALLKTARFACVGASTAASLQSAGADVAVIGVGGREELLKALAPVLKAEKKPPRCLVLLGTLAPPRLAEGLRELGAEVETRVVYETVRAPENGELLARLLRAGECQAIAFGSTSAVEAFGAFVPDGAHLLAHEEILAGSIGASTSTALHAIGVIAVEQADEPSFEALAECLRRTLAPS